MSIDFERILSRISAIKAESSSSISYVDPMVVYRRDLNLILLTVKSFVNLISWGSWFKKRLEELKVKLPTLLTELVDTILACQTSVEAISKLFDREAAETTGQLTPSFGTCPEYDDSVSRLNALEEKLHGARRKAQAELFGGAEVSFADLGKDIFLYEVSTSSAPKLTPKGLVERSRNAKAVRYIDSSLSSVVEAHKVAASAKASGLLGVLQKVAARICDYNTSLYEAAAALSYLDCLLNLSDLPRRWPSSHFPQLMECGDASAIQGENLVHPLMKVSTSSTPVPNSVTLDNSHGRVLVLTGPNMAGKSTLMRTLAVNVLLAQLGGPICGTGLSFSPVDRIFTRIGARDASHKGQSTLFVELNETAEILKHATSHSLCLIDELGRGTSTHDGMAIAQATLDAIQGHTPCAPLTIFSTHYHSIALELVRIRGTVKQEPLSTRAVQTGYMNFVLEKEDSAVKQEHPSAAAPSKVVFLYQLVPGVCDRSYGVEVARMAGVREPLLQLAALKSAEMAQRSAFHEDVQTIRQFLSQA
ncbi:DNA mismatch repair protein MSH6 [Angomonas deanei]|uniref:MutS domain V, putative n=1 Tax=Angomonas deanei TaxID=59799 RepID=A0A7G2C6D5_9TRYP|nr:DNA mismatch repair protein MSH6 [Angomonas deanei]CAD2214323.1 MutS domain V, putative [Angomonas deanei]|eukprot:EPY34024.1 DNA mismatch repair protein MSH6 [Angomonas deanei]